MFHLNENCRTLNPSDYKNIQFRDAVDPLFTTVYCTDPNRARQEVEKYVRLHPFPPLSPFCPSD